MVLTKKLQFSSLETMAYVAILQKQVSTESLAKTLRVSRSTAARTVAALRKKGVNVVSVRERASWHYEIRNAEEVSSERWEESRLRKLAGFAKGRRREGLKPEDEMIYGQV